MLYLGLDLPTALMESVFHKHRWLTDQKRSIALKEVQAMHEDDVPLFDGVLYPSRNNYPAASIALFERAAMKVKVFADIDLVDHVDWPRFVADYRIGVEPDPGPPQPDDEAS